MSLILARDKFRLTMKTFRTEHRLFYHGSLFGVQWLWFPMSPDLIVELVIRGTQHETKGSEHLVPGRED